jgi:Domain of unknown function (DUF4352)
MPSLSGRGADVGRVAVTVLVLTMLALAGCAQEGEEPSAERQGQKETASGQARERGSSSAAPTSEPGRIGDTAEVGPFLVTLNGAEARLSGGKDGDHHYAVADLTLENGAEESLDPSGTEYLLRDEEGYSFETGSLPEQKPRPEGQVTPGGKASGEVAFDLGTKAAEGPLTLSVSLSGKQDVAPALFEFEVKGVKEKPQAAEEVKPEQKDVSDEPEYEVVSAPSGGLTVEVPPDWEAETGSASEGEGGPGSWSYYAGEDITASITAARSLAAWQGLGGGPTSGTYVVGSTTLAQNFTDEELIYSQLFANKANNCAKGPYEEFDRGAYSAKMQEWNGCGINGTTSLVVAASPEGRECVVVMDIILASDADREAAQHILDTFEVDCGALPPPAPTTNEASATASASASASPESSAEAQGTACDEVQDRLNAGDDSLTSAELLACGLSPEAINPCEGNPDPSCGANLPEGAYPSIGGPDGVGTNNACSDLPEGSPEAVACYEDLIGTASASASAPAINNNPKECEYVGETGAVHDPNGTCTPADIEAANR